MKLELVTPLSGMLNPTTTPYKLIDNPPSWFKEMSKDVCPLPKNRIEKVKTLIVERERLGNNKTYKVCPALHQIMRTTIVVPAPFDIRIYQDGEDWGWSTPNEMFQVQSHPKDQHRGFRDDQVCVKIPTPWSFVAQDSPSNLLFHHPHFHNERRWDTAVGTFDVNTWPILSVIMWFDIPADEEAIEISAGTPLVYLSTTDEVLDLNTRYCDQAERDKIATKSIPYSFSLKKVLKSLK